MLFLPHLRISGISAPEKQTKEGTRVVPFIAWYVISYHAISLVLHINREKTFPVVIVYGFLNDLQLQRLIALMAFTDCCVDKQLYDPRRGFPEWKRNRQYLYLWGKIIR